MPLRSLMGLAMPSQKVPCTSFWMDLNDSFTSRPAAAASRMGAGMSLVASAKAAASLALRASPNPAVAVLKVAMANAPAPSAAGSASAIGASWARAPAARGTCRPAGPDGARGPAEHLHRGPSSADPLEPLADGAQPLADPIHDLGGGIVRHHPDIHGVAGHRSAFLGRGAEPLYLQQLQQLGVLGVELARQAVELPAQAQHGARVAQLARLGEGTSIGI